MKILQINKFLYQRGGAETYLFQLSELLQKNGHEVIYFSQKNPKNISQDNKKLFISNLELGKFSFRTLFKVGRIFWCFEAERKIAKLIKREKPDIVHIHNIYHQISPSILRAIKKAGIPIVMTVHDFKLIDPNYTLRADGQKNNNKNSLTGNLLKMEFNFHKFLKIYQKNIDLFIAPSQFVKRKLIQGGFDGKKITVIPHFINTHANGIKAQKSQKYILSLGRLDESKGVDTLIKAFSRIENKKIKLKIAGTGPQEAELKKLAKELEIENRVEFLGQKSKQEIQSIIKGCLFTVFPSKVHETFGLGILESFSLSKPVIATKVGAFPELIKNNKTGRLVKVNSPKELATAIDVLISDPLKLKQLGKNANKSAQKFSAEKHYESLAKIYKRLISKNSAGKLPPLPPRPLRGDPRIHTFFFIGSIAAILLCFIDLIIILALPQPRVLPIFQEPHEYPRIANLFWKTPLTMEEAKNLASWDLVVLDMSAQNQSAEAIKYLRQLNPKIIILAYTSFTEMPNLSLREPGDSGVWHDLASGIKIKWQLKTYEGKNVSWWPGNISVNPCGKDEKGNYYQDYAVNFLNKKIIGSGLWDGIFFDTTSQEIAWVDNKIDIDGDGKADSVKKINDQWHKCHQDFFDKLRKQVGKPYLLLSNGDGKYNNLNGRMFEGFPEVWEGDWVGQMKKYKDINNTTSTLPRINIINSDTNNTGNDKDYQTMRFGITSALMFNGFYSFDYGTNLREQFWTYDEYAKQLGVATGGMFDVVNKKNKEIKESVWQRNFEKGIVLVNSTKKTQTIRFDKKYKKISGTQDTAVNNGNIVSSVSLKSRDGIILLNIDQ